MLRRAVDSPAPTSNAGYDREAIIDCTKPGDGVGIQVRLDPGSSVDVMAQHIRVKAGLGGETHTVEGWYVLVS
ncbi:MAG TPA: hypothetical protein VKY24_05670 [Reyranella sp.]|nr:hypothetical protein [Reyranella sp.]